jgi:hypothetical protein
MVVGASGYFGSLVVEDALRHTDYDVWVGSRGGRTHDLRRFGPRYAGREVLVGGRHSLRCRDVAEHRVRLAVITSHPLLGARFATEGTAMNAQITPFSAAC